MNNIDKFYSSDKVEAFQVLSFNDENTNPVEIEIHNPVEIEIHNPVEIEIHNPDEYEVNKGMNFHSVRITLDKEEFTQLAINWLKINGLR